MNLLGKHVILTQACPATRTVRPTVTSYLSNEIIIELSSLLSSAQNGDNDTCGRPLDEVGNVLDVGDVGRPALDQVPGDQLPILADGQGKLARRVNGDIDDTCLVTNIDNKLNGSSPEIKWEQLEKGTTNCVPRKGADTGLL